MATNNYISDGERTLPQPPINKIYKVIVMKPQGTKGPLIKSRLRDKATLGVQS